jgi:hypothetical protein
MCYSLSFALFLLMHLISPILAQESGTAINSAQERIADSSWPKKPGNQVSPLSGKMKGVKQIDQKEYATGKEFKSGRLYQERRESSMASVPMWAKSSSSSIDNKESSLSPHSASRWDQSENSRFSQGTSSSLQGKQNLEQKEFPQKEAPDWSSRSSRTFQDEDGTRRMYQGRLIRVRERVSRDDPSMGRDLGDGKKEMYSPAEVKKILEGQPAPIDPLQKAPVKVPIKAESPMASLPSPQGN